VRPASNQKPVSSRSDSKRKHSSQSASATNKHSEQVQAPVRPLGSHRRFTKPESDSRKTAKSSKRPKDRISRILLITGIVFIAAALSVAGYLVWRNVSANSGYDKLAKIAGMDSSSINGHLNNGESPNTNWINWDDLRLSNPNVVAWLYLPDTGLNYPIVQGSDNAYYLTHMADNSANASGAIFLDWENSPSLKDKANYVYGHNMLGNYMFSEIEKFAEPAYMAAHPNIIIFTPTDTLNLDVLVALRCKGSDPVRLVHFGNDNAFHEFTDSLTKYIANGDPANLQSANNIYVFSTCKTLDSTSRVLMIATLNSGTTATDSSATDNPATLMSSIDTPRTGDSDQ
jgi:sortase B